MKRNRKWVCVQRFVAWLMILILFSTCSEKQSTLPRAADPSLAVTTVTYRISSVSGEKKTKDNERFLVVSFDGNRSASQEISGISGFPDTVTFYRKKGDSTKVVLQELPWRKAAFRVKDERTSLIPDSLAPTFIDEQTALLGHACRKAVFRYDNLEWEVWFTPELQLHDSTQVLIAHRSIPGTILKAIRSYRHRKSSAATVYEVTRLQFGQPEAGLQFPQEAAVYAGEDPRDHFLKEFDSLTYRQDTIPWQLKDRFIGKWQLGENGAVLAVERYGEVYLVSLRSRDPRFRSAKADPASVRFYKDKLWFSFGNTWHWLAFCKNDEMCSSICSDCRLSLRK